MAKPGKKPTPTALKKLRGNPGRRPLPKNEPQPKKSTGLPRAPTVLNKPGQKEWRRMVKELHPLGLLTNIDLTALTMYCAAYSDWIHAQQKIQEHGMLVIVNTVPQQSPWMQISNKAAEKMLKYLPEFGMTPSSRSRVSVQEKKKADPLADFQAKGKKLQSVK